MARYTLKLMGLPYVDWVVDWPMWAADDEAALAKITGEFAHAVARFPQVELWTYDGQLIWRKGPLHG